MTGPDDSTNGSANDPASHSASDPLDPLARLTRARAEAPPMDADPLPTPRSAVPMPSPASSALAADAPGIGAPDMELTEDDRDLLVALAAFQLRYGEDAEALAYLLAARLVFPADADVLRLLAHALVKLERAEEADAVLAELDRLARPVPPLALLSRALVRLAQGHVGEARRLFAQYRERDADARDPFDRDPYDRDPFDHDPYDRAA